MRYVDERRAAGDARLFPLLKQDTHGKWTDSWGKWWKRYRSRVGVGDRWKDAHALRHTFIRQCRECGVPEEIRDAITGHTGGGIGRTYGGRYPLRSLHEAMQRVRYDGLELSRVVAWPA